jgi:hypothetical protein
VANGTLTQFTCDLNPADTATYNGFQPTNDYIFCPSGEQLTEMQMDSNNVTAWQHSNVWAGGKLLGGWRRPRGTTAPAPILGAPGLDFETWETPLSAAETLSANSQRLWVLCT